VLAEWAYFWVILHVCWFYLFIWLLLQYLQKSADHRCSAVIRVVEIVRYPDFVVCINCMPGLASQPYNMNAMISALRGVSIRQVCWGQANGSQMSDLTMLLWETDSTEFVIYHFIDACITCLQHLALLILLRNLWIHWRICYWCLPALYCPMQTEWVSSFLTALQHNVGYLVPYH